MTTSSTTLTETTTTTSSTETRTLSKFDCTNDIIPLQLINRNNGDNDCAEGSDIKQLDINEGTYTQFCAHFETQCFNACGLNFNENFIYCRGINGGQGKQLLRLDCSGGKACWLGSLESGTFAANFDPTTGDYVMTNELVITIVSQVDKLPCLGAPGPTLPKLRTIDQTLNKDTDPEIELADLMVLDMRNFGFPSTGGASWMIRCVNGAFNPPGNRVYIQSLTDATEYYVLNMLSNGAPIQNNLGGLAGAQWQFGTSLFCAYNTPNPGGNPPSPGGVWELDLTSISLPAGPGVVPGTIEAVCVSDSEKTNSNDGLNCIRVRAPSPPPLLRKGWGASANQAGPGARRLLNDGQTPGSVGIIRLCRSPVTLS